MPDLIRTSVSLRLRLTVIILLPLMIFSCVVGLWQLSAARQTAAEVFDRSLLSAALAVANDITVSQGDALSPGTRDILASTSGGRVFYHMYAPDGVIVAGYATPPVGIPRSASEPAQPTYFEAIYLGQAVHGVRLPTRAEIDGIAGVFTTTVWQDSALRTAFVRDLMLRTLATILALIGTVALIVWFGVRLGLRPLLDLETAIAKRSSSDLSPIRRAVPREVAGVTATLNRLFGQVSGAMTAQSEFIGNAAHQLRNPIAGVLALAEAVIAAPSADVTKSRAKDLLDAARDTADLSQKLLLLDRAENLTDRSNQKRLDLSDALPRWVDAYRIPGTRQPCIKMHVAAGPLWVTADETMLREALVNLLDNAASHGGDALTEMTVSAHSGPNQISFSVRDNGIGIAAKDHPRALQRFVQLSEGASTGLGLSIVQAVAEAHGGTLELSSADPGLIATLTLPRAPQA